jgi:hypothetical protein
VILETCHRSDPCDPESGEGKWSLFEYGRKANNMLTRQVLRGDLEFAWRRTIEEVYDRGRVDSEASLQVHFSRYLLQRFEDERRDRRIFVEPNIISIPQSLHKKPDLLICNQRSIIGIVELKYKPRARAIYTKDLETLDLLSKHRLNFVVSNERYLGPSSTERKYKIMSNAVLCWAAIYSGERIKSARFEEAESREEFLGLHALTSQKSCAIVLTSNGSNSAAF